MSDMDSKALAGILAKLNAGLGLDQSLTGKVASATFARTAIAYDANDVVGTAQAFAFGSSVSGEFLINSAVLEIDASALISGETSYNLQLYNVTPPSAHANGATWDLPSGDRTAHIGTIPLGTPIDLGSTLKIETDGIAKQITLPSGGTIYGELVTVGAYTGTAVSCIVALHGSPV